MKLFKNNKITCSSCGDFKVGGQWKDTVDDVKKYYIKLHSFDFGTLYSCPNCKTLWYLNNKETALSSLWQTDRIDEWKAVAKSLPDNFVDQFKNIGATPPDFYGNGRDFIDLPCKVIATDGTIFDPALIRLQKDPPFINPYDYYTDYLLINNVRKIEESDFTLPRELRLLTCQAREVRMCFSPTRVQGPNGVQYLLNGVTNFFYQDNVKGKDLMKVPTGQAKHELDLIDHNDNLKPKFIIGLWDDKLIRTRIEAF